jgi:hypothetical protein
VSAPAGASRRDTSSAAAETPATPPSHLHFHLQHSPVLQDGLGIKCFFQDVALDRGGRRETLEDYSPVKGDVVLAE